jgi:hypothetical protein
MRQQSMDNVHSLCQYRHRRLHVEQEAESTYIPTREGTEGLRILRTGDEIRIVMLDINGAEIDVAPVIMRPSTKRRVAA